MTIYGRKGKPTAQVGRILSSDIVSKIRQLFIEFGEIPYYELPTMYQHQYAEILDLADLGFDNGLVGFLSQLDYFIDTKPTEHGYSCVMKHNAFIGETNGQELTTGANGTIRVKNSIIRNYSIVELLKERKSNIRNKYLFDSNNTYLWLEKFKYILKKINNVVLVPSPLEEAYCKDLYGTRMQVNKIRKALARYPNGIELQDIENVVGTINKSLFGFTSIGELVDALPELFYRVEPKECPERPMIYDGHTKSFDDVEYFDINLDKDVNKMCGPFIIAHMTIITGLYQKTLILIKQSGLEGLKLTVWEESLKRNFKIGGEQYESIVLELPPLKLFLTLAHVGLVEIKSHPQCKNDLRVHFPSKEVNFEKLKKDIVEAAESILISNNH